MIKLVNYTPTVNASLHPKVKPSPYSICFNQTQSRV